MFDAKSILDALVRGGGQQQRQQEDLSSISDLLKQLGGADQGPRAAPMPPPRGRRTHGGRMTAMTIRTPKSATAAAPGNAKRDDTAPCRGEAKAAAWTTCCAASWEAKAELGRHPGQAGATGRR